MGVMSAADYQAQLLALLPQGLPWPREPSSVWGRLLGAWATELARVDGRAADLLGEADPRTTVPLLADWERAYGLPGPCAAAAGGTDAQRRVALVGHLTALRGQAAAFYIALAASVGVAAEITEYRPHTVDATVDADWLGPEWGHAWSLTTAAVGQMSYQTVSDRVDRPLASWPTNAALECLIRRHAPAHTVVLFNYV